MERAQPQSPLFAVPPEVHGIVVSYVGRSAAQPSCSPAELFRACRDLHALGRDTSVRIGWLLAVFGARMVGDGMGGFLALLTREVVEGVFRRVGQVPRYQLQRLFRRFSNAGRTDLLLPVLQYADEMYPPPSHELVAGPKAFPPIGLGFNPSLPDEDLFKKLLKEGVTEETAYLVAEGKAGGFAEKGDDDVMTALLTLREKYLFDVNHTIPGRSPSSGRILFRGQERPAYYSSYSLDRGTGGFTTDVGIEGTNGGHVALVEAIHNAREASVRRLLQLGVSVHAASGSLFWEAVEEARAAIAAENAEVDTAALERSGIYNAAGRAAEHLVTKILNVPMDVFSGRNVHDYMGHTANAAQLKGVVPTNNGIVSALCRAYGATMPYNDYQYFRDTVKGDCTDALQVAVCKSGGGDAVLRILLESKQDEGWFQTDAGKQSLETCIQLCLKVDRLDLMDLLQQYSRLNSKDAMVSYGRAAQIVDLVSALCAQDREAALKLINEGWTLSEAEAVGLAPHLSACAHWRPRQVSLLRSRNLAEAHSIILEHVKFQPSQITSILTNLIRGSYNERQRMMATIARVLTAYKDVWSADGEPRQWMMKAFEDSQFEWVRPTMRPFLGPSSSSFSAAVLRYDLREAVTKDDVKELKKLAKLGAKLPTYMVLQYIGRYTTARTETLLALIDACSFSASELSEILAGAITRDDQVVESLLDEKRKIRPLVTWVFVLSALLSISPLSRSDTNACGNA
ncbi:hypothetical protein DFJ74DRAFT_644759 [Hyaloraphidium curvatum]|nr:hypothetical protein DFJ74DRAFT_644759 [Hyaloraphidium curvatum]